MEKNIKISLLLDIYGELLTERQRQLLTLRVNDDLSLSEISEIAGISRQGVRDTLVKGEEHLYLYEQVLHLLEKQINQTKLLEKTRQQLTEGADLEKVTYLLNELMNFMEDQNGI